MSSDSVTAENIRSPRAPVTCLTCYDYLTARVMDQIDTLDCILVGDSLGMVSLGYENTLPVTVNDMVHHTAAVSRGTDRAFLVADVPFLEMAKSAEHGIEVAQRLMQKGGAQAVKVEGGKRNKSVIEKLVSHHVPVIGHLGLTPQSVESFGGYKLQATTPSDIKEIFRDAKFLDDAGVLALVLECIPSSVAQVLTSKLDVTTIGIGAGPKCDGQVLVWQDMMGLTMEDTPRFVREYDDFTDKLDEKINSFCDDVRQGDFPASDESFDLPEGLNRKDLDAWMDSQ